MTRGTRTTSHGYVILACDHQRYLDMAVNLARSVRYFDRKRSICLVHNSAISVPVNCRDLFDDYVLLENRPDFVGVMNKARLYELSPYEKSMYLDSDMLLLRSNIDAYWEKLRGQYFNMTGAKRISGNWYGRDIAKIITRFNIPYLVQMNSGVFYFEKLPRAQGFFRRAIEIFDAHKETLSAIHQGIPGQFADEPIFGVAMGECGIQPIQNIHGEGSWMVTTFQTRHHIFDPENGVSYMQRSTGYPFRQAWLSKSWIDHSPNFVHFVGLKPRKTYDRMARWFEVNSRP
jgi:hypothetical protein